MNKLFQLIQDNPALQVLEKGSGNIVVNELFDEAYLIASSFAKKPRRIVVVKNNLYEAQQFYQTITQFMSDNLLFFPYDESMRMEVLAASPELLAERIATYDSLLHKQDYILITHTNAIVRKGPTKKTLEQAILHINVGDRLNMNDLKRKLIDLGYQYIIKVDEPFYYSFRGGIIDVFSINYDNPVRIEFFDDEIDSIRFFDEKTQRTISTTQSIRILPATDLLYTNEMIEPGIKKIEDVFNNCYQKLSVDLQEDLEKYFELDMANIREHDTTCPIAKYYPYLNETASILSYVEDATLYLGTEKGIKDNYKLFVEELFSYHLEMFEEGRMILGLDLTYDLETILAKFSNHIVSSDLFQQKATDIRFDVHLIDPFNGKEEEMAKRIAQYLKISKILIVLNNENLIRKIMQFLGEHLMTCHRVDDSIDLLPGVNLMLGQLNRGFELDLENIVVLTGRELFGILPQKKKSFVKYKNAKVLKNFDDLQEGDYIVHDTHGIGQYLGIKTLEVDGIHRDYLYIAYRGNDTLYIPVEQFKMIRKYQSREGRIPKINKLGGTEWTKTKQKLRKKADDLADGLIKIYAERLAEKGFAFGEDGPDQVAFENDFGYELTADQQQAVEDIKKDMMQSRPMDRLLCGDVGFGKTEVALRAAFKAVENNKQVVFLCPTTILSSQHYRTMVERFKQFPVEIELLNRFVSGKKAKEVLNRVKEGKVDILVGTHRVLSKDVQFKDLGLLIIDEEQRFGVRHKEKIKDLKKTVDVLTLTATPIPRTLQMSLMGIRGLSTINTPPKNRLPVQTFVVEKNNGLIKQIIERELARNGQVFYLYNRTDRIDELAAKLESMIPNAKVGVGHGKMDKDELEDVMLRFINHEFNILVCTTIIETGIDIPNANTIIIEDADHFGLSQLYQIKGRVGRSDRYAYAYLLHRPNKEMTPEATKRLKAIKEFTALGSGYKIAMRDLNIRGAGDILGGEQAGFIDTVGFDMFMRILEEAIQEKTGHVEKKEEIPSQNLAADGYVPKDYVNSDLEKLRLYQALDQATNLHEVDEVKAELTDLYGKLPKEVETLVEKREFDILAYDSRVEKVLESKTDVELTFTKQASTRIDGNELMMLVTQISRNIRINYTFQKIVLKFPKKDQWLGQMNLLLRQVDRFCKE